MTKTKSLLVFLGLAICVLPYDASRAQTRVLRPGVGVTEAPMRGSEADAIAALEKEAMRASEAEEFSGALLVAKNGKAIFQKAYGYAEREQKVLNTLDTKFRFGSMAKMFTGVAALQLVQAGKLRLDAPLSVYLPDYPNKDVASVTIHQLLTHTGGTGDIFGPVYQFKRKELKEHSDYIKMFGARGVRFEPGSRHEYSNYGMVILGRVIEVVSGESYYDYVDKHIFKPAGMTSTGNTPNEIDEPNRAVAYTRQSRPGVVSPGPSAAGAAAAWLSAAGAMSYRGTAAGGGFSTVADFLKFVVAVTDYKLLDAKHTQLLLAGKVDSGRPGGKYAYGFEDDQTIDGVRRIGHGGGAPGMNGRLSIYPESGYVVIALSNFDPPAAQRLTSFVSARLPLKVQ